MQENIDEVRISDFIMSLSKESDSDILKLKEYAISNDVPIIRDETRDFIRMILEIYKPKEILEIGTAIGYSTILMHKINSESNIVTIEDFERRVKEAKKNIDEYINKYKPNGKITLLNIDATNYLKENTKKEVFDFVFLDAAKAQYINWLPSIKRLMKKNSILVSDNIFKDGEILESKFLIKKRDRTIHKRMREFLKEICNDKELSTYIYNLGDGISLSIKK